MDLVKWAAVATLTAVLGSFSAAGHPGTSRSVLIPQDARSHRGESWTLLPDGRWLVLGGEGTPAPSDRVALHDPVTGEVTERPVSGLLHRAWHTATVLPDGRVLIVGGLDAEGRPVPQAQLLDMASAVVREIGGLPTLANHTATLLTDGRVLFIGGRGPSAQSGSAIVWDSSSGRSIRVSEPLLGGRIGHRAVLQPDGSVLVTGGTTAVPAEPLMYLPEEHRFVPAPPIHAPGGPAALSGSIPEHGATAVDPSTSRLALRFSASVLPQTINSRTIRLNGPAGPVRVRLVAAEEGRLAFIAPERPLAPGSAYAVEVDGPRDSSLQAVPFAMVAFTTAGRDDGSSREPDSEFWRPDGDNYRGNWSTGRGESQWQRLPPLRAAHGVTAVAGQALTLGGQPLADVKMSIDGVSTYTDRTGRFLLQNLSPGRHTLMIDGRSAGAAGRRFGVFHARLYVRSGITNALDYTIWMPRIDVGHAAPLSGPLARDLVVRTPLIPGLELHIPKGSVIRDHEGQLATEISITPVPVDRPPFPLPTGVQVPVYFTIQPGGGFIESPGKPWPEGARVIYPNYTGERPGTRMNFWNYDPEERGWHVYGLGSVSPDANAVVPDGGVVIYRFTGTMINFGWSPPPDGPPFGWWPRLDPVDPSTGLFVLRKTDLYLPDVLPLALTRTYRQNDTASRPFGIGATHPYAMFLWSAQQYQEVDLILPDGGRIHYVRTSPGTGYWDAEFEHTTTPGAFFKSRVVWNGNGWDLKLKDGTVYVFGNEAPLQSIRDPFGNTVHLTWSSTNAFGFGIGNIVRVASPHGRWIEFTYDSSNRITEAADNIGRTVGYEYDASGRLWKVTDPAGGITEYTYDASHRMLTIKDPRGIVYLTNEYDANGRVVRQTQADTTTMEIAYTLDGSGRVAQADITNARGYVERLTFNTSGYPTSRVEAVGTADERTTTFDRAPATNAIDSITDPLNRTTEFTFDSNGNTLTITRLAGTPNAVTTTFTYEPTFSLVAGVTDPLSHTTSFSYDTSGRLTAVTDPLSHQTTLTYNAAGQPLTMTNAGNETTAFAYDLGDLVSVTDPLGRTATQFVDAAGRVIAVTNAAGESIRYEYNALNLLTKITDPLGGTTEFTYDGNGNLLTLTDARGKTTTWTYDNMDRVDTRTDPLLRQESFDYDANGNLTQATDRKGQVTLRSYDSLDRLISTGFDATGTPPTYESTIAYTYDDGDRLIEVDDSAGGTITRTYDLLDRLTSETTPEGSISYTYDDADRRATMTVAGQTAVSYTYDNADRLTGITQGSSWVSFTYDDANRRTSLTLPNGIVMEYGYDAGSQLTGITYKLGANTLGNLTYAYDLAGRRTGVGGTWARTNLPSALASATYDDANQIATWGGTTFTYDANGNLTNDGSRSYTWNARNELTALSGAVSASFAYDGFGRRRSKIVSGASTGFLYDELNPVQELAGGLPSANLLTGLNIDEFLTRTDASGTSHFLTDALGSTVGLSDGSGSVQTEYTYEPFGALTTSGAGPNSSFAFTGREIDGTGLYFYRARYYDPRLQRFSAEDPLQFDGGDVNLHAYVANRPTMLVDPTGEFWQIPLAGCLGGALGAGLGGFMSGRKPDWLGGCAIGLTFGLGAGGAAAGAGAAAGGGAGGAWGGGAGAAATAATAASAATKITAFSKHGIDQVINRGVRPQDILEAIRRPIDVITKVDNFGRTSTQYIGNRATVVLNPQGKVVTAWNTAGNPLVVNPFAARVPWRSGWH